MKTITKQDIETLVQPVDLKAVEAKVKPKSKRSHHVVLDCDRVYKTFVVGGRRVPVLKDVSLKIYSGEFAIIYGPSGCGKSTLLHTILGLEEPTRGKVTLRDVNMYDIPTDVQRNYRREKIGMVFQQSNWIKSLTVWENVAYPLWLAGITGSKAKDKAIEALANVGMERFGERRPAALSGGQQQRVALARALVSEPWMIIADEPTGNLDTRSSEEVMEVLTGLNRNTGKVVLMVTHELSFLPLANRRVGMKDGEIIYDTHD